MCPSAARVRGLPYASHALGNVNLALSNFTTASGSSFPDSVPAPPGQAAQRRLENPPA